MSASLGSEPRSVEVIWMADFEDNIYIRKFFIYAKSRVAGISLYLFISLLEIILLYSCYSRVFEEFNLKQTTAYRYAIQVTASQS
jgi:hypothetical protein